MLIHELSKGSLNTNEDQHMKGKTTISLILSVGLARMFHENAEFWGNVSEAVCSIRRKA
jgi:hypothetical protein